MRTWGGPNAPHIKTLTLGKNIFIIQRATGNGPPDTKVVDVHLHGLSYNSLFISIRSRGRHPLTRLQRQKGPRKPLSLAAHGAEPGWVFFPFYSPPSRQSNQKKIKNQKKKAKSVAVSSLVVGRQTDRVKKRRGDGRRLWKAATPALSFHCSPSKTHSGARLESGGEEDPDDKWPSYFEYRRRRLHQICDCDPTPPPHPPPSSRSSERLFTAGPILAAVMAG